ncbi:MAG: hypothetical protein LBH18_05760 [Spirochaetaceae bacterium]|jgi:YbbR domain-containing protein|nr:hypothetical protein [Spirochaetaceae bacterium]
MNLKNQLLNINKIIKIFTVNSPAKILSLALAMFLFMFHNINLLKTKTISSKLETDGAGLIITNTIPENVSVKLRGNESDISGISGNDIITFIDLSAYKEKGVYHVPVKIIKSGVTLDMDTLDLSIEPTDILVHLDKPALKTLKISPNVFGKLAPGYDFISESLEPEQVQIEGPESMINTVSEITTEPLDISGRYQDFSLLLNLAPPGPFFTFRGESSVEYNASIRERSMQKQFSDIPVVAANLPENFTAKILPETGSLTLSGAYTDVIAFVPWKYTLSVDCSAITAEGNYELSVKTAIGNSALEQQSYQPERVMVEITKQEDDEN